MRRERGARLGKANSDDMNGHISLTADPASVNTPARSDTYDCHTGIEYRRTTATDPVSFDTWIDDRGDIERRLKLRMGDRYRPMAWSTFVEPLDRRGPAFLAAPENPTDA